MHDSAYPPAALPTKHLTQASMHSGGFLPDCMACKGMCCASLEFKVVSPVLAVSGAIQTPQWQPFIACEPSGQWLTAHAR